MPGSGDTPNEPTSPSLLVAQLRALGVVIGDVLMVHASLKAIGPVHGGAGAIANALCAAVGVRGGLMAYASWDRSPYGETLNGRELPPEVKLAWPAFEPASAGVYPGFGMFNEVLRQMPGAARSPHPDASMIAVGPMADYLVREHKLGEAYGRGSPLERLVRLEGQVLLLGAPLSAITLLHHAEALADIPGKRQVTYQVPLLGPEGQTIWRTAEELDSNGILDIYAGPEGPDAVELIARDYVAEGRHREGPFGRTTARLFDSADLVRFGTAWLEARHAQREET